MNPELHPDNAQLARFQDRRLEPQELLAVGAHLAVCAECRDALYRRGAAQAQLSGLRLGMSEHLDYEQVAACAESRGDADAEAHLAECPSCREEVKDLRTFRERLHRAPGRLTQMPRRAPRWLAAAAALIVVAGVAWRAGIRLLPHGSAAMAVRQPAPHREPALPAAQQEAVDAVLASGRFARPPVLDLLVSRREVLLGGRGESPTFEPTSPVGTAVTSDRPEFRWQAVPGATRYVVSVFDQEFNPVAQGGVSGEARWQPSTPLPRGRFYQWQVAATVGGETLLAPVPPAPEARFQVAPAPAVAAIEQARREHPDNHLLLAALLVQCGALDEAAAEVDALAASAPERARALRESLAQLRR